MDQSTTSPTRADLARYFLRLGALGFGGPIALVGHMHRDLVEGRGWSMTSSWSWNSGYSTDPAAPHRFPSLHTLGRPLNGALVVKAAHRFAP